MGIAGKRILFAPVKSVILKKLYLNVIDGFCVWALSGNRLVICLKQYNHHLSTVIIAWEKENFKHLFVTDAA